jgi:Cdc6-like AAA superfamily ATPase
VKAYAIVGRPGSGKTTTAKRIVQAIAHPLPPLVYDVNAEWGEGPLPALDTFLSNVQRSPGRVVVFEDATLFFSTSGNSQALREVLIRKRHTRTTVLLLFHGLNRVPLYILDTLDAVILHRTNDVPGKVAKRFEAFPGIAKAFDEILSDPSPYPSRFVPLQ